MYVACTRARKSLHLVGNASLLKSGMRPDKRSLLHLLWSVVASDFEAAHDQAVDLGDATDEDIWLQPELRRFATAWELPAAPKVPISPASMEDDAAQVEFYWVGAGARIAGTLVHRWVQLLVDAGEAPTTTDEVVYQRIAGRWLREMGVADKAAPPILERSLSAIKKMTADEKGRWLLQGEGHAELALSGSVEGRLESVVLDRVRIDDDGIHWIVDYKTSSHEGGGLDTFLQAETDRYRPQLAKYAEVYRNFSNAEVRCALYFPLLQEFVEVDV